MGGRGGGEDNIDAAPGSGLSAGPGYKGLAVCQTCMRALT